MAALQVKQICMYLKLADLPKIIDTKLDQGPSSHICRNRYRVPKPFKKYYDGKCSQHFLYAKGKDYNSN